MSVNRFWIPGILIAVLLGTAFGSQALGVWSVSGRDTVNLGQFAPEDIKGWMTLQQVADGLGMGVDEVYRVGGIPAEVAPGTALKDMEEVVEVSTLRDGLAAYLGGETSRPAADEAAPEAPARAEPTAAPASAGDALPTADGTGPTPLPPGEILPASEIKGRMTLREVSEQCAVELDALLAALNLAPDTDPDTQLKTLTQSGALDEVTQVQEAVASLQG